MSGDDKSPSNHSTDPETAPDATQIYLEQLVTRLDEYEDEIQRLRSVISLHERDKSVDLDLLSIAETEAKEAKEGLVKARQEFHRLEFELAERAGSEASLCSKMSMYEERLAEKTKKEAVLSRKISDCEKQIQMLRGYIEKEPSQAQEGSEVEELIAVMSDIEKEAAQKQKKIRGLKEEIKTLREAFQNLAQSAGISESGQALAELQQSSADSITFEAEELEDTKEAEIESLKERVAKLNRFLSHVKKAKNALSVEIKEYKLIHQHQSETNELKLKTVKDERHQLNTTVSKITDKLCELEGKLTAEVKKNDRLNNLLTDHREERRTDQTALTESKISAKSYKDELANSSMKLRNMAALAMRQKARIADLERQLSLAKQVEVSLQNERRKMKEEKERSLTTQAMNEVYKEESRLLHKKLNAFLPRAGNNAGGLYELDSIPASDLESVLQTRELTIEDILKM